MKRLGRKHRPFFRICVMDSRSPRDGKAIEEVGFYDPMVRVKKDRVKINLERIDYWLGVGAQPTDTVRSLLRRAGILKRRHEQRLGIERKTTAVPVSEKTDDTAATSA